MDQTLAKHPPFNRVQPVILYALPVTSVDQDGPKRDLILDGIEASSLNSAPRDLGSAAQMNWEPSTWMLAIPPEEMKSWPVLNQVDEDSWLTIRFVLTSDGTGNAFLFPATSQIGTRQTLRLLSVERLADRRVTRRLDGFARLSGIQAANRQTIATLLNSALERTRQPAVVAYDVGQANWNAVIDVSNCPTKPPVPVLFFDCGSPLGWYHHTLPTPIIDPFANARADAPVVLSHWDMDHWAGAVPGQPLYGSRGLSLNWSPDALARPWIVPNQGRRATGQKIRSTAWRLALALHRLGRLIVWPTLLNRINLNDGSSIVKCVPAPRVRGRNNNSGLAMIVNTGAARRPYALTILPGDADYASLEHNYPELRYHGSKYTGLVASHHGSDLVGAPPQALSAWSKLAISHGLCHGHPTSGSLAAHTLASWAHQYQTHVRLQRVLANGTAQKCGNVVLGAAQLALSAVKGNCANCPAAIDSCPIQ